jgi:hypothetical protein
MMARAIEKGSKFIVISIDKYMPKVCLWKRIKLKPIIIA